MILRREFLRRMAFAAMASGWLSVVEVGAQEGSPVAELSNDDDALWIRDVVLTLDGETFYVPEARIRGSTIDLDLADGRSVRVTATVGPHGSDLRAFSLPQPATPWEPARDQAWIASLTPPTHRP